MLLLLLLFPALEVTSRHPFFLRSSASSLWRQRLALLLSFECGIEVRFAGSDGIDPSRCRSDEEGLLSTRYLLASTFTGTHSSAHLNAPRRQGLERCQLLPHVRQQAVLLVLVAAGW